MKKCKIISVKYKGKKPTCNVTMLSEQHNYAIVSNGNKIYTRNSHACAYAYEAWKTAYLKAHYPLEFMCARLSVEASRRNLDDVYKYEHDCASLGIKIYESDLNKSKLEYTIVGEKALLRPLILKGVGDKAAEEIVKCQPFDINDLLYSFSMKVGSVVNSKVVEALAKAKMFGNIPVSEALSTFEKIKAGRHKSIGKQVGNLKKGIRGKAKKKARRSLDIDL